MIMRPEKRDPSTGSDAMLGDHDGGLQHDHNWARERTGFRRHAPVVAHASTTRTPSSVFHDDAIYAAG